MFEHRIPRPSTSRYGLIAALCFIAIAGIVAIGRYWSSARTAAGRVQSPLSMKRPALSGAGARPAAQPIAAPRDTSIKQLAVLIFKSEKRMEVWAFRAQSWSLLREYPILAASGGAGPKLAEGDRQVPEGVYRIVEMNPRSRFHMSIKLNYPNAFDTKMAEQDGRMKLGGDICVHGKNCSIGCVAIGDPAIEDLYALIERTGAPNAKVIIAPNDLREHIPVKNPYLKLSWLKDLYEMIGQELKPFKKSRV